MIVDVITYNGERDLFDIRYNVLKDYVDEFIVVEFDKTFSGKPREMSELHNSFDYPKMHNWFIPETAYNKYEDLAKSSPNTEYGKGAEHWIREFCQKESIKDCLTHLKDDDVVIIGDCDEIWKPIYIKRIKRPIKLGLLVYSYYLNQRSSEQFYGPLAANYSQIKNKCLNHLRTNPNNFEYLKECGWHFTSMANSLKQKIEDSYTKETYANDWVMQHLEDNVKNNKDFLGRDFKYWIDESDWPPYLKENKDKYKHLMR